MPWKYLYFLFAVRQPPSQAQAYNIVWAENMNFEIAHKSMHKFGLLLLISNGYGHS